jgi:hypothetical protein
MPRRSLFDARSINLEELLGNGTTYSVPIYQRDYSWTEAEWQDLWDDIRAVRDQPGRVHFMGPIVLQRLDDERAFLVVDGQQRLATLSILVLAAIGTIVEGLVGGTSDENRERSEELRRRFIRLRDVETLVESSKLTLNETDRGFFRNNIVQLQAPQNLAAAAYSQKQLWSCLEYFRRRIADESFSSGSALARFITNTVGLSLIFLRIEVASDDDAYVVFETLNSRGIALSSTDLIKNHLFSRLGSGPDLDYVIDRWRELIATVEYRRFPEFLRYFLAIDRSVVRSAHLFRTVRSNATDGQSVISLIDALGKLSELFASLRDEHHAYWSGNAMLISNIRALRTMGVTQFTPILFAAWNRVSQEDFARIVRIVVVTAFRYIVVGRLNTTRLEPAVHAAAKALALGEAKSPRDVYDRLAAIRISDPQFRGDFANLSIARERNSRLLRYIFGELEADLQRGLAVDLSASDASIEHILPSGAGAAWSEDFPGRSAEMFIDRLGNICLLRSSSNARLGLQSYADKLELYRASEYASTRQVADDAPVAWTPDVIQARQARMADRAVHIWRYDFE